MAAAATLLVTGGGGSRVGCERSSRAQYQYGAPTNTAAPAVTGTAQVGQTLTTSNGTWSDTRGDVHATRGTAATRRVPTAPRSAARPRAPTCSSRADQGHTIRSAVTATNASGSTAAQSAQTAVVTVPQQRDDRRGERRAAEPAHDRIGHVLAEPDQGTEDADDDADPRHRPEQQLGAGRARLCPGRPVQPH